MKMIRHLVLGPIAAAALLVASAAQAQTGPNPVNYQAFQDFNSNGVIGTVVLRFSGVDNTAPFNVFDPGTFVISQLEFWGTINGGPSLSLIYNGANLLPDPFGNKWTIGDTSLANSNGFLASGLSTVTAPFSITWGAGLLNSFAAPPDACPSVPTPTAPSCGTLTVFDALGTPVTEAYAGTYANVGVVPEPSTYLMMAFGIAALAFAARRRSA